MPPLELGLDEIVLGLDATNFDMHRIYGRHLHAGLLCQSPSQTISSRFGEQRLLRCSPERIEVCNERRKV